MNARAVLGLAARSLWARRGAALLTVLSIATATLLFLAVENLRQGARDSFERTLSGTDLIVGARSSPINLVMFSIFQMGEPTNPVSWDTAQAIAQRPDVAWTVPLSLGDSHRGFRVIGTTLGYFRHYQYGRGQTLAFQRGQAFDELFDVVVGARVARELGYDVGDRIVLSHGLGGTSFVEHTDTPFTVKGVLAPTGTPVDRSVLVGLSAITAIHEPGARVTVDGEAHEHDDGHDHADHDESESHDDHGDHEGNKDHDHGGLEPGSVTAVLVGVRSPVQVLRLQRDINTYRGEALSAVIPGVALGQLWSMVSVVERALALVSAAVIAVGLVGVLTATLAALNARRREMSILRAVGASGRAVLWLLVSEAALLAALGAALGVVMLYTTLGVAGPALEARFGIAPARRLPGVFDFVTVAGVTAITALLCVFPATRAMRRSVSDGLSARL